jgi:hypothetical protein
MLLLSILVACETASSCEQLDQELCIQGQFDARGVSANSDGGWIAGSALSDVRVLNGESYTAGGLVVAWDEYGDTVWAYEGDGITSVEPTETGLWLGTEAGQALYLEEGEVLETLDIGDTAVRDLQLTDHGLFAVTETELVTPWGASWDSSSFEPHTLAVHGDLILLGGEPLSSFEEASAGGAAVLALNEDLEFAWVYAREGQLSGMVAGDAGIFAAGPMDGDLWLDRIGDGTREGGSAWGETGQEGVHAMALVDDRVRLSGWTIAPEGVIPWLEWRSSTGGLQGHDALAPAELMAIPTAVDFGADSAVVALEIGVADDPATSVIFAD